MTHLVLIFKLLSMRKSYAFLGILLIVLTFSCKRGNHFISDSDYRQKVKRQFEKQKELAHHRSDTLFGVFREHLTTEEKEALEFLYAYMSLNDLADYDGAFFLKNVRTSLAARDTFSWGKKIPEEVFRHFVLPIRVNNENLDSSRWVFFSELKERIKGRSMKEAALEVNHWCHEKVNYRGTDGRTSSPLATVKTAYGRCGEESTFTTAALRSISIPARQCYTPRWAHCDDNHAWVEVWIDSTWHFLGACEPEPDLDMAWFSAPAKRAMLVNTNVFGDYDGPEDILLKDERFTQINILANYTDTKRLWARVLDKNRQPVPGAEVQFQLYNYAEFYPLLKANTDANGLASLLTGYGDLLIWASKEGLYGFSRADVRTMDTVNVLLNLTSGDTFSFDLDFIPPIQQPVTVKVSDSFSKKNSERLKFEDQLRAAYEGTFIDSSKTYRLALTLELNPDTLWYFLEHSRGNWREIISSLTDSPDSLKQYLFPLLSVISEKDLHDIEPVVLLDALMSGGSWQEAAGRDISVEYILNPRIDNELLKPYHSSLRSKFSVAFRDSVRANPSHLAGWISEKITIDKKANYGRAALTPIGVMELRVADPHSRDIFFVAVCRSFGIPARLEPATKIPQYFTEGHWKDLYFEEPPAEPERNATLKLLNDPKNPVLPQYYTHYTVEQEKNGFPHSLDYESSPLVQQFPVILQLVPGTYLVVTGNRLADGTVLTRLEQLLLQGEHVTEVPLVLRHDLTPPTVYGSVEIHHLGETLTAAGISAGQANGMVMAWVDPGKEPTNHLVADLKANKQAIEKWKGSVLLFCPGRETTDQFILKEKKDLPGNVIVAQADLFPMTLMSPYLDLPLTENYPIVLFINPRGLINFFSEGYRIGSVEGLLREAGRKIGN